jgi:hypothetical protein
MDAEYHARAARHHEARAAAYRAQGMRGKARGHDVSARNHARLAFGTGAVAGTAEGVAHAPTVGNDDPPEGHRLCNLSYFEFYRPPSVSSEPAAQERPRGLFIHQFPPSMTSDVCAVLSEKGPPLRLGDRLFAGITENDVKNLLSSLTSNEVVVDHLVPTDTTNADARARESDHALKRKYTDSYTYPRGMLEFGMLDVLWMLKVGYRFKKDANGDLVRKDGRYVPGPLFVPSALSSSAKIAEYLNNLTVNSADYTSTGWMIVVNLPAITGVDNSAVDYGDATTFGAYCRGSSLPQRTFDVVPLLLMKNGRGEIDTIKTTMSVRGNSTITVDQTEYPIVGLAFKGAGAVTGSARSGPTRPARLARNCIIGAGEHVEPSDLMTFEESSTMPLVCDGTRRTLARLLEKRAGAACPVPVSGGIKKSERSAIRRALVEEVGLSKAVLDRAQMWMVGRHETNDTDAVARDPRYWPRRGLAAAKLGAEPVHTVEYGYRRNCATIVFVAVMDVNPASDEDKTDPTDKSEIHSAVMLEWGDAVKRFNDEHGRTWDVEDTLSRAEDTRPLRPAFGWAHQRMVEIVDEHMASLVLMYAGSHRLTLTQRLLDVGASRWRAAPRRDAPEPATGCAMM